VNVVIEQVVSATRAYYEAFARCDVPATMDCWAEPDDIACLAPLFAPAVGRDAVEALYRDVFGILAGEVFTFEILQTVLEDPLAIVTCTERATNLTHGHANTLLASNVFTLERAGWRLLHRHVSWREASQVTPGPD
jgi:ketosteroid isomerase-like protein